MTRKIIFDTDPGVDDATAILFAHRHPEIALLGVTTIFGNADIRTVTRNALYLKKLYGFDAPVAKGAARGLATAPGSAPAFVHGDNGLGDVPLDETGLPACDPRPAHEMISDLSKEHPGEITIVAVGRMTNLALALSHDPEIVDRVAGVIIMGGAFFGPGNVNPAAEANIFGDPHAADQVFGADWPVTAIGLDVTQKIVLPEAELAGLANPDDPAASFVVAINEHYMRFHDSYGIDGAFVHDSSALAYLVAPELFTLRQGPVRVTTEGIAAGQTIQKDQTLPYGPTAWDERPAQSAAADVDADQVRALLMKTLAGSI